MFKPFALLRLLPVSILACALLIAEEGTAPQQPDKKHKTEPNRESNRESSAENYLKCLKEARTEQIRLRLDISEERAKNIADQWADLDAPIRRIHRESMTVWRQMQFVVQEASPEKEKSRKIKPLYDQYTELRKELSVARQRLHQELPKMGDSPIQQVRILLLMEEMERKERDGLRTHMGRRKGRSQE